MNELVVLLGKRFRYAVVCDGVIAAFEEIEYDSSILDVLYSKTAPVRIDRLVAGIHPFMLSAAIEGTIVVNKYSVGQMPLCECISVADMDKLKHFAGVCKIPECKFITLTEYYKRMLGPDQFGATITPLAGGYAIFVWKDRELFRYDECTANVLHSRLEELVADTGIDILVNSEMPTGKSFEDGILDTVRAFYEESEELPSISEAGFDKEPFPAESEVLVEEATAKPHKRKRRTPFIDKALFLLSLIAFSAIAYLCFREYSVMHELEYLQEDLIEKNTLAEYDIEYFGKIVQNSLWDKEYYSAMVSLANTTPYSFYIGDGYCAAMFDTELVTEDELTESLGKTFSLHSVEHLSISGRTFINYIFGLDYINLN